MPLFNPPIRIDDEGALQGYVNEVNFVGAGVVASVTGAIATVTISGGGSGSFAITQVEVDFGASPVGYGEFTVIDAAIVPTSLIIVTQDGGRPTGRDADENEMAPFAVNAEPGTGSFLLRCIPLEGVVTGTFLFNYTFV
jgi:hypothetical protein